MITILIKTFKRPQVLQRLIDSIKRFQPDVPYIVLDDDDDIGVSAGRNRLVEMCETEYCLVLDDDCVFTEKTDLKKAVEILKERDLDILQLNIGEGYQGIYKTNGGEVTMLRTSRDGLYDFVSNVFVAKTAKLRECKWDENLKIGEHFAYFYTHKGKLRIGLTNEVKLEHHHTRVSGYNEYRERALDYVKEFMRKNGISKRIDGNEIISV